MNLILLLLCFGLPCEGLAREDTPPAGWEATNDHGRTIMTDGLTLVDWEGYIANPATRFWLVPPADTVFPASAILTAAEPRLHFDLPCEVGPDGPRKEVVWRQREKLPVYLAIFPDRDGNNERHELKIKFRDAREVKESLSLAVRVIDQDRVRTDDFSIAVDFSQDRTGFFKEEDKRTTVIQAARDWAYFFADMNLERVDAGAEKTLIWGQDGFKTSTQVTNAQPYRGYLLYAYGIKNELPRTTAEIPAASKLLKRDLATRLIRSGGEPSPYGGFQVAGGQEKPIRRSGGLEIEVRGNYNTRGWVVTLADTEWWQATNLGDVTADLYSIAHHEIGHALVFNPNNRLVKRGETMNDERVRAYLGQTPALNQSDHLDGYLDPASLHGAFGNEYHGRMPRGAG